MSKSNPKCPCGNPSSILINDETGYCCESHQKMHKLKLKLDAAFLKIKHKQEDKL